MEDAANEKQIKKIVAPTKIFPVPLDMGEMKENISIYTNSAQQVSQEQILSQALSFHSKGKTSKAAEYYQYLIGQGFKNDRVFCNYGVILENLGKLEEAELSTRKAIELNPNYVIAHSNLGMILRKLGKLQEAESSLRKCSF